jgi:hypothetical protein
VEVEWNLFGSLLTPQEQEQEQEQEHNIISLFCSSVFTLLFTLPLISLPLNLLETKMLRRVRKQNLERVVQKVVAQCYEPLALVWGVLALEDAVERTERDYTLGFLAKTD